LAIIVNNWNGGEVSLKLNGSMIDKGKNFRQGIEYDVAGNQKLIVLINQKSTSTTKIELVQTSHLSTK